MRSPPRRGSEVVAVDVNPVAVSSARQNAQLNGLAARIDVRESDVFRLGEFVLGFGTTGDLGRTRDFGRRV
jgi:tRNA G37 N-methylase Trm5